MTTPLVYEDSLAHIRGELLTLNLRLHRQVLRWRATHHADATPDELLGLTLSDREIDPLLDSLYADGAGNGADALDRAPIAAVTVLLRAALGRHAAATAAAAEAGTDLALPRVCTCLGLDDFGRGVMTLALAPEVDRRYERLFAYLNDDASARWPTIDLALRLFHDDPANRAAGRGAFADHAPLRALRILSLVEEPGLPRPTMLARGFALDARVTAELLGLADQSDPVLDGVVAAVAVDGIAPPVLTASDDRVVQGYSPRLAGMCSPPVICLRGPDQEMLSAVAAEFARGRRHHQAMMLDGAALAAHSGPEDALRRVLRDARLQDAAIVVTGWPGLATGAGLPALRALLAADPSLLRILLTDEAVALPDLWGSAPVIDLAISAPDVLVRRQLWARALEADGDGVSAVEMADRFRLTARQITLAATRARARAELAGREQPDLDDLFASSRIEAGASLAELAERVESAHGWDDIILPPATMAQLRSLEQWVRNRHRVFGEWGFERRVMLGRGLAVLFSGPSGTGKTMAAGILARALGLDLYRIDLSSIVSKYIGETEKSLSRVFAAAEASNAILFFDEADALFGKRSEVKDAHDRYANIEVSYLLQRMEAYDGIAVLATNFRQNLDQAFARRLQVAIEFPLPHPSDRLRMWQRLLPPEVPQAAEVDLCFMAQQFALTGGSIKNCAVGAAFAAAADDSSLTMRHLVQAVAKELTKLSQPIVRSQFGPFGDQLRGSVPAELVPA